MARSISRPLQAIAFVLHWRGGVRLVGQIRVFRQCCHSGLTHPLALHLQVPNCDTLCHLCMHGFTCAVVVCRFAWSLPRLTYAQTHACVVALQCWAGSCTCLRFILYSRCRMHLLFVLCCHGVWPAHFCCYAGRDLGSGSDRYPCRQVAMRVHAPRTQRRRHALSAR